jgi:hypothetical protein
MPKKTTSQPANPSHIFDEIKLAHGIVSDPPPAGQTGGLVDIITFCKSPDCLNLPGSNVELFLSQRVVLKSFYMGTRGNEELDLDKEEWQWLWDREDVYEVRQTIEKLLHNIRTRNTPQAVRFSELTLVLGRRSSKTTMASIIASYEVYKLLRINGGDPYSFYGIPHDKEIAVLNVATSQAQAGTLFDEIQTRIRNAPCFAGRVAHSSGKEIRLYTDLDLKKKHGKQGNIEVKGSVLLMCGHSNPNSLRGGAAICVIFDELAFYDEGANISGRKFYEALVPSVGDFSSFGDGVKVEISTPGPKTGIFHGLWKKSLQDERMLSFRMPTWKFNPRYPYDHPEIAQARDRDPASCAVEWGAAWPESGVFGLYFRENMIEKALEAGQAHGVQPQEEAQPGAEYYAHVDPALTQNNYAMVVVQKQAYRDLQGVLSPRVILAHLQVWIPLPGVGLDLLKIDQEVLAICRRFRPLLVSYDQWGSQGSLAFLKRNGVAVRQSQFNRRYKQEIYQNLQDLMSKPESALWLYDHPQLIREMLHIRHRPTPRGISIGANPHGDCPTDDCVDCLAGAAFIASHHYYGRLPQPVTVYTGMR